MNVFKNNVNIVDSQPLLSICIPTYNRASYLKECITRLISLPSFDNDVEVVVSDNASTDDTEKFVRELIHDNPSKNISYSRNTENTKDLNFYTVLSIAEGKYRKLLNDNFFFNDDDLSHIKRVIKDNEYKEGNSLFFYNRLYGKRSRLESVKHINNVCDFVTAVHNKITWISNFGCYSQQIPIISKLLDNAESQLLQMEWTLHLVDSSSQTSVYSINSYRSIEFTNCQRPFTPYNFFTPHVVNYYSIIQQYAQKGKIGIWSIMKDRNHLLKSFVGKKFMEYVLLNKNIGFDIEGSWKIMWHYFWMIPRFYYIITFKFLYKSILNKIHN